MMYKHICFTFGLSTFFTTFGTKINPLNFSAIEGENHYTICYSLVTKEIQDDKEIEKLENLEQGILHENIKKTDDPNQFEIHYSYHPIKITKDIKSDSGFSPSLSKEDKKIIVDHHFKPLTSDNNSLSLPFYLNNFRYGLNLNPNSESTWAALLFDNTFTYHSNPVNILDYSQVHPIDVEYKVTNTQLIDTKNKKEKHTISWNACSGFIKNIASHLTSYVSKYSRRHGNLTVYSDGTSSSLKNFTLYLPEIITGFGSSYLFEDTHQETCLSIDKMNQNQIKRFKKNMIERILKPDQS